MRAVTMNIIHPKTILALGLVTTAWLCALPAKGAPDHLPLLQTDLPGSGSRTFPETGKTVKGLFLEYWDTHGGLSQQGFPISELLSEKSDLDGKTYTAQYFERAVFEYHPENQAPYNVLLSQLGTFRYKEKYPGGAPGQRPNTSQGSQLFSETGKRVGGKFLEYWRTHGGLAQQGFPISDEFTEVSDLDGKSYTVQYFERAVFELHPENQPPYDVLLSQLGTFRYRTKYQSSAASPSPTTVSAPGSSANNGPAARAGHDLVYDDRLRMVLLVNGGDAAGEPEGSPSKLWALDGSAWKVVSSDGPEVRSLGAVGYDSQRNVLVTYGGSTQNRVYNDTWEWDGTRWSKKEAQGPGLRHHTSMVYDAERKLMVMYGGNLNADESTRSNITFPTDTWTWNGQAWHRAATTGPGPRYHYAMTYDSARKKVLIFGGVSGFGTNNDLWSWDGAKWSELIPEGGSPSIRSGARMAFDERSGKTILFGGLANRVPLDDTWEWDGSKWTRIEAPGVRPPARSHHAMAYDRARDRIILFGGAGRQDAQLADTWEWDGSQWLKVAGP